MKRDAQEAAAFICLTRSSKGEIAAENVGCSGFRANASFVAMWWMRESRERKSVWILARSGSDAEEGELDIFWRALEDA